MKRILSALCFVAVAAAQGGSSGDDRGDPGKEASHPPVLLGSEAVDNVVVTLPGAAVMQPPPPDPAPRASARPAPDPSSAPGEHRPVLRRAPRPILPAEFERDSGFFCQKLIGAWTDRDAYNLFGAPLRQRPAFDDDRTANGVIYAYSDPTGRYREIELDFEKDTGILRSVFLYPWKLSWRECRDRWGARVESTEANNGRRFHSYVNRRLDVLVDAGGNVISLGLY